MFIKYLAGYMAIAAGTIAGLGLIGKAFNNDDMDEYMERRNKAKEKIDYVMNYGR